MFLVSDVKDGSGQQQVASVVEQTTRFNYYKITIAQGIVIDPRHPDEATVFALVVNPSELSSLRDRLRVAFHDRVEEAPIDPEVVTQLADIGQVQACPPSPIADMVIPREALALQTPQEEGVDRAPAPEPSDRDRPDPRTGAELARGRAGAGPGDRAPSPATFPSPARQDRSDFVVLVSGLPAAFGVQYFRFRPADEEILSRIADSSITIECQLAKSRRRGLFGVSRAGREGVVLRQHDPGGQTLEDDTARSRRSTSIRFDVGRGEIVGLLGPNGAGKTTTMRMLTTYLTPTSGRAQPGRPRRARRAARGAAQGRLSARKRAALHRDAGQRVPAVPGPAQRRVRGRSGGGRSAK